MGYSPWGHKESDTTERLHFTFTFPCKQALRGSWLRVTEREVNSGSGKEGRWEGHHGDGCRLTGCGNTAGEGLRMAEAWQLRARGSHAHLALEVGSRGN